MYDNGSEADFFVRNVPADWLEAWSVFSLVLVGCAAIFNSVNLFALLLHCCRFKFTPTRNLLLILFVHDLLLSAFFYPAVIDNLSKGNHGLWNNVILCQVFGFSNMFCSIHTTFMGAQIALYRAFMTSQTWSNSALERKQETAVKVMTTTTTIVGLLTASLPYMFGEMEVKPPYGFCGPSTHKYGRGVQIGKMVLWVFVPSAITLVSYLKIYSDLKKRRNAFREVSTTPATPQDEGRLITASLNATYQSGETDATLALNFSTTNRDLFDQNYNRAGSRLKCLSKKMLAMLLTKLIAHMPLALFYMLTTRENRSPIWNLVVLFLNFASTLNHPIVYGVINSQMREPYCNIIGMFRR